MSVRAQQPPGGIPSAGPQKLTDLIEYRGGSVVSRALIKKETGNVTLFAFEKGEGLSEHTAPFDAIVYLMEGEADIAIAGEAYRVHGGETITLPANRPHALKAITRFKMLLVMIRS